MAKNAAAGRLASGVTLKMFADEAVAALERAYIDAQQFAFNVTGNHEEDTVRQLNLYALGMITAIMEQVTERANRLGIQGTIVPQQIGVIRLKLDERRVRLTDDFAHGMLGSELMKKDPLVNVVNNNSPGSIQQVGVGNFSQSVFVQRNTELISAIDQALSSSEFKALSGDKQASLTDVAEVLKAEASKNAPDPGKLKRWGDRFVQMCGDVGIKVAGTSIAQVLIKMFGG